MRYAAVMRQLAWHIRLRQNLGAGNLASLVLAKLGSLTCMRDGSPHSTGPPALSPISEGLSVVPMYSPAAVHQERLDNT